MITQFDDDGESSKPERWRPNWTERWPTGGGFSGEFFCTFYFFLFFLFFVLALDRGVKNSGNIVTKAWNKIFHFVPERSSGLHLPIG